MRELIFETRIQLEDNDIEDETLIDNLLTYSRAAVLNSTLDINLSFGILIKELRQCPLLIQR